MKRMEIPAANLFRMLCYAGSVRVGLLAGPDNVVPLSFPDHCALLFERLYHRAERSGALFRYERSVVVTSTVRGKIDIGSTIRCGMPEKARVVCEQFVQKENAKLFPMLRDVLSGLLASRLADGSLQSRMQKLYRFVESRCLPGNCGPYPRSSDLRCTPLYDLVSFCEYLSSEFSHGAERHGTPMLCPRNDGEAMAYVFERFLRNFYRIECRDMSVVNTPAAWSVRPADSKARALLPAMKPDIVLRGRDNTVIIDAKYYSSVTAGNPGGNKLRPDNLYQIFSYMMNIESSERVKGILLYPRNGCDYHADYHYREKMISVRTVDLCAPWDNIHTFLLDMVRTGEPTGDNYNF